MMKRFVLGFAAALVAGGLAAAPAVAQEAEEQQLQEAPAQEPGVEYEGVCPPRPEPAQCAPCAQQQQQAATETTVPVSPHHGLLLMGYIGVNAFPGKGALDSQASGVLVGVGPGLRVGGLVGFYATPRFSVNGELGFDFVNTDDPVGYWKTGGRRTAVAISPLFHLAANASSAVEVAVGPKLGLRWMSMSSQSSEVFSSNGTLLGLNAGVFARGGAVMIGGLISFDVAKFSESCRQLDAVNDYCSTNASDIDWEKVVSLSGSILY
jgi:hypothetical protein